MARISDLWDGSVDQRCMGLVPCRGRDGYRAQVLQHPRDITYTVTVELHPRNLERFFMLILG